jgi:hypothetical protein
MRWNNVLLLLPVLLLAAGAALGGERLQVPMAEAPTRGPATATVTMIEFLDFQ